MQLLQRLPCWLARHLPFVSCATRVTHPRAMVTFLEMHALGASGGGLSHFHVGDLGKEGGACKAVAWENEGRTLADRPIRRNARGPDAQYTGHG